MYIPRRSASHLIIPNDTKPYPFTLTNIVSLTEFVFEKGILFSWPSHLDYWLFYKCVWYKNVYMEEFHGVAAEKGLVETVRRPKRLATPD